MKRCLIRADAGPGIGGGHVVRCIALAQALEKSGWHIDFACQAGSEAAVAELSEWPVIIVSGSAVDQANQLLALGQSYDMLLVDHYGLDTALQDACRTIAGMIVAIDDVPGERQHRVDVLIDGAPGRRIEDWSGHLGKTTTILAGGHYALIRDAIMMRRVSSLAKRRNGNIFAILVTFGLADTKNATVPALHAARRAFPSAQIDVVIGETAIHRHAVAQACDELGGTLHIAPANYIDLMIEADLAIGAGGVSALERACLGIPSLVVETALNQRAGLEALSAQGAVRLIGRIDQENHGWSQDSFASLELAAMSAAAAEVIDGMGTQRVAMTLDEFAQSRATVS